MWLLKNEYNVIALKMNTMWLLGSLGKWLFIWLKMNTIWLLENEYNVFAFKINTMWLPRWSDM
jgi:hypothetical protein